MPYDVRALRPPDRDGRYRPHSIGTLEAGGTRLDVIRLDDDTYVHESDPRQAIAQGTSCAAYVAQRVGDARPAYCVRRFGRGLGRQAGEAASYEDAARAEHRAHLRLPPADAMPVLLFTADSAPWGTVEVLARASLFDSTAAGQRVGAADLAVLLLQVARSLQAAHARGIRHGDIKSANVLIFEGARGPSMRLADWDQARPAVEGGSCDYGLRSHEKGRPPECGPDGSRAPLSRDRSPAADLAADVYALAYMVIRRKVCPMQRLGLTEASALLTAFEAIRRGEQVAALPGVRPATLAQLRGAVATVRALEGGLGALLLDMIAVNPADRPTIDEVVARLAPSALVKHPERSVWFVDREAGGARIAAQASRLGSLVGALHRQDFSWCAGPGAGDAARDVSRAAAQAALEMPAPGVTDAPRDPEKKSPARSIDCCGWMYERIRAPLRRVGRYLAPRPGLPGDDAGTLSSHPLDSCDASPPRSSPDSGNTDEPFARRAGAACLPTARRREMPMAWGEPFPAGFPNQARLRAAARTVVEIELTTAKICRPRTGSRPDANTGPWPRSAKEPHESHAAARPSPARRGDMFVRAIAVPLPCGEQP